MAVQIHKLYGDLLELTLRQKVALDTLQCLVGVVVCLWVRHKSPSLKVMTSNCIVITAILHEMQACVNLTSQLHGLGHLRHFLFFEGVVGTKQCNN